MRLFRILCLGTAFSAIAWGDPPSLSPDTLKLSLPAATGVRAEVELGYSVATDGGVTVIGVPFDDTKYDDAGVVKIVDTTTGALLRIIDNPAPNPGQVGDSFGSAVAVSGGKLVVSTSGMGHVYVYDLTAPANSGPLLTLSPPGGALPGGAIAISGSRIIIGCPFRVTGPNAVGVAYVYDLTNPTPADPVATLLNPTAESGDFGSSVGISGTQAVVGEPETGVGPGRAYTYDLAGPTPTVPSFILTNPNAGSLDSFGYAVAISGSRVVVSAPDKGIGPGITGAVMTYDLSTGTPTTPVVTLLNPVGPEISSYFGAAVALRGTRLVVGALFDKAYAYELAGAAPATPVATLSTPTPGAEDYFGLAVAIDTKVVVGAPWDNARAAEAGAAYLYEWPASGAGSPIIFNQPSPALNDTFGFSAASSGTRVLIGAPGTDTNDLAPLPGYAQLFDLAGPTPGTPTVLFENPTPAQRDYFGWSVALSGHFAVIGAPFDDTAASDGGAVYAYDLNSATPNVPVRTLTEPIPGAGHDFGAAVALSGTRLAVAAPGSNGSVYVYDLSVPGAPALTVPRPAAAPSTSAAVHLAMEGNRLVVGWPASAGVPAYAAIYDLASATPTTPALVLNVTSGDVTAVAIDGNRVAVAGSEGLIYQLDSATPATPAFHVDWVMGGSEESIALHGDLVAVGKPSLPTGERSGEVQVFALTEPSPIFATSTLTKPAPQKDDRFGSALVFVGGSLVVGAFGDDTAAQQKGGAYLFGPALDDADGDGLLDLWEVAHFGSREAHTSTDDTDHDGFSELMELALNQDPNQPDGAASQSPVIENGYLTLTIAKRAGVYYTIESAAYPFDADFSAATTTALIDNATTLKVRDNVPIGDGPSRFLRTRVTAAP